MISLWRPDGDEPAEKRNNHKPKTNTGARNIAGACLLTSFKAAGILARYAAPNIASENAKREASGTKR